VSTKWELCGSSGLREKSIEWELGDSLELTTTSTKWNLPKRPPDVEAHDVEPRECSQECEQDTVTWSERACSVFSGSQFLWCQSKSKRPHTHITLNKKFWEELIAYFP
jgi:hypothetical protein